MTGKGGTGSNRPRQGITPGRFSNASLALTILAVIGVGGFIVAQELSPTSGAKATSSPTATVPPPDQTPLPTPAATAQPTTGLTGVFPSPDATIPPDAPPVIPSLRVEDLAAAAEAEGMICLSQAGTYQEGTGGYTLACEGADRAGHAKLLLTVTYWALDGVSEIYFSAYPDQPGAVVSPSSPVKLMSSISSLSTSDVAKTWVLAHLDDEGCREPCIRTEGTVRLVLQVGGNGGRALHVIPTPR
jgi:hypothetical protein